MIGRTHLLTQKNDIGKSLAIDLIDHAINVEKMMLNLDKEYVTQHTHTHTISTMANRKYTQINY